MRDKLITVLVFITFLGVSFNLESAMSLEKQLLNCPNGYILVPANSSVGTMKDFCVAQFEMKNDTYAKSQPAGRPWVNIDQYRAQLECSSLGKSYHLINNEEWLTIARNIENTPANWSSNIVGVGTLEHGHSDFWPARVLEVNDLNDPYNGTLNDSSDEWHQRRTMVLSNGNVIWDFAGNAWEWVDWNLVYGKASPRSDWAEVNDTIQTPNMPIIKYRSENQSLSSTNGIGKYYAGADGAGGAALRGGGFTDYIETGIYTLFLNCAPTGQDESIGFRCTYSEE